MTPTSETPIPVAIALSEVQRASRNARRFWNLLYAVGTATAMALIVGILLATLGHSVQAIVTGVATLLGGAGSAFLVKMKNDAVEELERAKSALLEHWKEAGTTRSTTRGLGEGMGDLVECLMSII